MQEDKEVIFDSVDNITLCLQVLISMIKEIEINKDSMLQKASLGHITATDLADFLVQERGVSFRDAHHIVGKIVAYAESKKLDISELSLEELVRLDSRMDGEAISMLSLNNSIDRKKSYGGVSKNNVRDQISYLYNWLDSINNVK